MPFDGTDFGRGSGGGGGGGGRRADIEDLVNVLYFLRQAEIDGDLLQGIKAEDAFASACRIADLDPALVRTQLNIEEK